MKVTECSLNKRVMISLLCCEDRYICLCNVYLPCFESNVECTTDLLECLSFIEVILGKLLSEYTCVDLCICGDFNTQLERIYSNLFVRPLKTG
jgi:hypothetical protein